VSLTLRRPARVFWAIALSVLALDRVSKAIVRATLVPGETHRIIPGLIDLTYVRNVGAAFGLFPGRQPVFIATSLLVLVAIAGFWRRSRPKDWPVVAALSLVAGGAVGNLIDRAVEGKVVDFLEFAFMDFPVFNVADTAIVVGVAVLAVWLLFGPEPERPSAVDQEAPVSGTEEPTAAGGVG
jgi:signal peptidase II